MNDDTKQQFTLGVHCKMDGETWLPVRFVNATTLHEEGASGTLFIDTEHFIELRNRAGNVRFAILSSVRTVGKRDKGPCRGIKPYFWKGIPNGEDTQTAGSEDHSEGDYNNIVPGGAGEENRAHSGDGRFEPGSADSGVGNGPGDGPSDPRHGD